MRPQELPLIVPWFCRGVLYMVLLCPCSRDQVFVFLVCVFLCSGYLSVVSTSEFFVFRFLCSQSIERALYPMSLRLSRDTTWQNNVCFSSGLSCPLPPPFAQTVALGALQMRWCWMSLAASFEQHLTGSPCAHSRALLLRRMWTNIGTTLS